MAVHTRNVNGTSFKRSWFSTNFWTSTTGFLPPLLELIISTIRLSTSLR